jgi:predicted lipid-binding transport protein (Tim44 family)
MTSDSASRVTRSKRGLLLAIALLAGGIVALGVPGSPRAQQAPASPQAQPAESVDGAPAPAPPAGTAEAPAATDTAPTQAPGVSQPKPADEKSPPAGAASSQPQERFVPTEKVRADFDVSFPVDI